MNVVVVRGQGQGMRVLRRDPYAMEVDRGRTVMPVEDLGTQPNTVGTGSKEKEWQREEDQSMKKEERKMLNI